MFGGYNPFGSFSGPQFTQASPLTLPFRYSPMNNGPTIPQSSSGGFQNAPVQPPSSGGFDLGGAPAGAYQLPGYNPSSFGFSGVREPINLSNGRDLYGAVAPQPQDQPQNPWASGGGGMAGYGPGAYNPWMSSLGGMGAMGMVHHSPFTGYFNNMAFNNVGSPNYDPATLNQTQSYAGLAGHLRNAWATQNGQQAAARRASEQGNSGGYNAGRGAAGAGAGWALGAGLGSALMPGPGTLAGAGLGALVGFL